MTRPTLPLRFAVAAALAAAAVSSAPRLAPAQATKPAAPAAGEAEQPRDPEKERAEMKQRAEAEVKGLPEVKAERLSDVVRLAVEGNDLKLHTTIPPTNGRARVAIPGVAGTIVVDAKAPPDAAPAAGEAYEPETFTFIRNDSSRPGDVLAITQVSLISGHLTLACGADGIDGGMVNVQLIQSGMYADETSNERVRVYVQEMSDKPNDAGVNLTLAALNVLDLRRKFPAETTKYLEPIFRDLGQANVLFQVDDKAAWQVLAGAFEPPADVKQKVGDVVKRLDADDPRSREAAASELEQLGQPAALVLMGQDRKGLSQEQQTRIDAFLAPYKPLTEAEAERAKTDVEFLLLALAAADDAVRRAALEQLKRVTKQDVAFDLAAEGQARHEAVTKLRDQLLGPSTRTATAPAGVETVR
jgi:hypothetical protein